ncbi:MAG: hypothetical protein ACYC0F_12030 [Rhodanobacter sp.]
MDDLSIFIRQVRSRSIEHRKAVEVLAAANVPGQLVAILRQELDSLVRVIYLLTQDANRRSKLVAASVAGQTWRAQNSRARVTDKEMVDLSEKLLGFAQSVYRCGCAFVHLSNFHDFKDRDPLLLLTPEEKEDILGHCRGYHGGPDGDTFIDLVPYLPAVFEKVSDNLECYLEELQDGSVLAPDEV